MLHGTRSFLEDGYIRLTQLSALNDPFEAVFCENGLDDLLSDGGEYDDFLNDPFGNEEYTFSNFVKERKNHVGVICFSESKDNLLMWAHYANDHQGIVVGILSDNDEDVIFQELFDFKPFSSGMFNDYAIFNGLPNHVEYRKSLRYRNDGNDFDYSNIVMEGGERLLYDIFMRKSDEWIYEKEHRIVLRLEQADKVIIKNLNEIKNMRIRNKIKRAKWRTYDKKRKIHELFLNQIKDDSIRFAIAHELAKLSVDPNNLYLMRINPIAIVGCIYGLRHDSGKNYTNVEYAHSAGDFYIYQSELNTDYYNLDFRKLKR